MTEFLGSEELQHLSKCGTLGLSSQIIYHYTPHQPLLPKSKYKQIVRCKSTWRNPAHLKLFKIFNCFLTCNPSHLIADFWTLGESWSQFASLVAPTMPVQYRAVYNVRTSEAEQDGNLKYVAYVTDGHISYHLGIVKRQHVEQVIHAYQEEIIYNNIARDIL